MGEETNVGFVDKLSDLIQNLDVSALVPNMDSVLNWIGFAVRLAVVLGPLAVFGLGLCYMLVPAKEANHRYGYRCYWGMGSVEAWKYTQELAGLSWTLVGLVMGIIMYLQSQAFLEMQAMDAVYQAVRLLFWQAVVMLGLQFLINLIVLIRYNRKGVRRFKGKGLAMPDLSLENLFSKLFKPKKKKRRVPGKKRQVQQ